MKKLIIIAAVALAGCAGGRPASAPPAPVYVEKRTECPDAAERDRLRDLRPAPLRDQPMPQTAVERVAKAMAQLGRYEAEGGWADQIMAALDRCAQT